jgi:hypothetical protein
MVMVAEVKKILHPFFPDKARYGIFKRKEVKANDEEGKNGRREEAGTR